MFNSILCMLCAIYTWNFISETLATPSQEECSRSFLGRQGRGVITSYNYPFDYLHNLTCTYSIHVTSDPDTTNVVCFTFHRFSLEGSTPFCSFDNLKLEYPNLKYCASGLWMYGVQTTSSGSNVWSKDFCWTVKNTLTFDLTFSSDNNINGAGFYAEYFIYPGVENDRILPPGNLGQAPCGADEWTCFNRRCIDQSQLCDGVDQCGDKSDEMYVHARCGEQNVLACDFTSGSVSDGYCGFTHEGWFRTREQNSQYGPQGDHTNGSSGFYVYSDVNQSSAFLLSPELTLPRNKTYCLAFWYYIYGRPPAAMLRVYVTREQAYSRPEWSRTQSRDNEWVKGEIEIHPEANIQVIFAAELDNSFSGVALDDVSILPGACFGDDVSCNFESGMCSWRKQAEISHLHGTMTAALSWKLHSRLLGPMGPAWDKSSKDGGGNYLYLNNSNALSTDNRALLVSPPISALSGQVRCLHFWYHMTGQDSDCCQLNVRLHEADDTLTQAVWTKKGDIRSAWKEAYVNLNFGNPFQVVLEGLVSAHSRSQLAIDQLVLMDGFCTATGGGVCEAGQYLCADGECIDATRRCDHAPDCGDGSDEDWRAGCPSPTPAVTPPPPISTVTRGPPPTCTSGYYPCKAGGKCIPLDWLCDHFSDCEDHSDETNDSGCTDVADLQPCRGDRFLCQIGRCIHGNKRCDGKDDCGDNSDEKNCQSTNMPISTVAPVRPACVEAEFMCHVDGSCIPTSLVCDGTSNCADQSDESNEFAGCTVPATGGLSIGAIIGIVIGCLVCIGLIILSAFLGKKRRKPRPNRRSRRRNNRHPGSEISTISEPSTMERHMSMLEAIRSPMRNLTGLPPYSEQNLENMGYTSDGNVTLCRNSGRVIFPPEEPPPPYDSVIKDGPNDPAVTGSVTSTPSRSSSARASRRRSRERTPVHALQNATNDRPERISPPVATETRVQEPVDHSMDNTQSDDSDTQNIYEELSVSTLRPGQLRQEPSSSSTLQHPPPLPPGGQSVLNSQLPNIPPDPGVVSGVHPHPIRTMPHQRIRLGTQALQNRQGAATYRPQPYSQGRGMPDPSQPSPKQIPRGYEPLDPAGPYTLQRNPYKSMPSPSHSSTPSNSSQLQDIHPAMDFRRPGEPGVNYSGRHSQRQPHRTEPSQSSHSRLYGSNRNPAPRNYGTNTPSQMPQPHTDTALNTRAIPDTNTSLSPRAMPDPNPALSPRAMPNPRPYIDNTGRYPRVNNMVPSPLQTDNYLYRPHDVTVQDNIRPPTEQSRVGPNGEFPFTRNSPSTANHARDWKNSSFTSTGSQEHLLGSPPGVATPGSTQYPNHPRTVSNISSDIDSTSPLVSGRDREREGDREDNVVELEMLTSTNV